MNTKAGAADVPLDAPSVARMYDYWLGGFHHFAIDRQTAEELTALYPALPQVARANRAALRRVVTFLAEQGIDQFLDIGSGIPTVGNVHEVAQRITPAARVVYVDNDPVAVEHSRAILADNPLTTVVAASRAAAPRAVTLPPRAGSTMAPAPAASEAFSSSRRVCRPAVARATI